MATKKAKHVKREDYVVHEWPSSSSSSCACRWVKQQGLKARADFCRGVTRPARAGTIKRLTEPLNHNCFALAAAAAVALLADEAQKSQWYFHLLRPAPAVRRGRS